VGARPVRARACCAPPARAGPSARPPPPVPLLPQLERGHRPHPRRPRCPARASLWANGRFPVGLVPSRAVRGDRSFGRHTLVQVATRRFAAHAPATFECILHQVHAALTSPRHILSSILFICV
jgi:hypothetical protein